MPTKMAVTHVRYNVENGELLVWLYGRGEDGRRMIHILKNTQPHFYVDASEPIEEARRKLREITSVEAGYKSLFGAPLKRVNVKYPFDVPKVRNGLKHYEADIRYENRVRYDYGIKGQIIINDDGTITPNELVGDVLPHVAYLDIEVDTSKGGWTADVAGGEILSMSILDVEKQLVFLLLNIAPHPMRKNFIETTEIADKVKKILTDLKFDKYKVKIILCQSEKALLERYRSYTASEHAPDIISGWNADAYDFPYLEARFKHHKLSLPIGMAYFDMMYGYSVLYRTTHGELESRSLQSCASKEIGTGKIDVGDITQTYRDNVALFSAYNIVDSLLLNELDRKIGVIKHYQTLSEVTGVPLDNINSSVRIVENSIFFLLRGTRTILPSGKEHNKREIEMDGMPTAADETAAKGAEVLEPSRGIFANVLNLDLKGEYPNIIRTFNISPETIYSGPVTSDSFNLPEGKDTHTLKSPRGVIPRILDEMTTMRDTMKSEMKKFPKGSDEYELAYRKQEAFKWVMNSVFGVTDNTFFRLENRLMFNNITSIGRLHIKWVAEQAKNAGMQVLYGDSITGSRCVVVKNPEGLICVIPISELFSNGKYYSRNNKILSRLQGWKALSIKAENKTQVWNNIKYVIKHKTNKTIYSVRQKYGETEVTKDHSLINSKYECVSPVILKQKNEHLIRVQLPNNNKVVKSIDVYEILKNYKYETNSKRYGKNIVKVKIIKIGKREYVKFLHPRNINTKIMMDRIITIGTKKFTALCRLIGAYVSEGSSSTYETTKLYKKSNSKYHSKLNFNIWKNTSRFGCAISNNNLKWLNQLKKDAKLLFKNVSVKICRCQLKKIRHKGKYNKKFYINKTYKLSMSSQLSAIFFKIICGQKSRGKKLPAFVFNIPIKYKKIIIENMILGDGSRWTTDQSTQKYKKNNFRYDSTSLQLISGLSVLLNQMKQNYNIIRFHRRGQWRISTNTKFWNRTDTTIKNINNTTQYVYDLEVEDTHMFVDACGQILLHNTDSCLVKFDEKEISKDELIKKGQELADTINGTFKDFVAQFNATEFTLKIDFKKLYSKWFQGGKKKRYAGIVVWEGGKNTEPQIEITGFDAKRSSTPVWTRRIQKELLWKLLTEDRESVIKYLKEQYQNLRTGKVPLEEIGIPISMTRNVGGYKGNPIHIRAITYSNAYLGREFGQGSKIKYYFVKSVKGKPETDVVAFDTDEKVPTDLIEVDMQEHIRRCFTQPFEPIIYAIGLDMKDLIGKTVIKLTDFK